MILIDLAWWGTCPSNSWNSCWRKLSNQCGNSCNAVVVKWSNGWRPFLVSCLPFISKLYLQINDAAQSPNSHGSRPHRLQRLQVIPAINKWKQLKFDNSGILQLLLAFCTTHTPQIADVQLLYGTLGCQGLLSLAKWTPKISHSRTATAAVCKDFRPAWRKALRVPAARVPAWADAVRFRQKFQYLKRCHCHCRRSGVGVGVVGLSTETISIAPKLFTSLTVSWRDWDELRWPRSNATRRFDNDDRADAVEFGVSTVPFVSRPPGFRSRNSRFNKTHAAVA